ncbi:hypothetical protein OUZ56_018541 [Daphnia magna]|uniref:Uncharacterized protein n=1 Tax=Daphnia magna TaxID=35525 RepID=A0ABQ9Z961_9CRUS|nr:hypothetical protein OUZ56_018541 [Daphnia magna]
MVPVQTGQSKHASGVECSEAMQPPLKRTARRDFLLEPTRRSHDPPKCGPEGGENFQSIPRSIISSVTSFEFRFAIPSRSSFSPATRLVPLSENMVPGWPRSAMNRRNAIKKESEERE